MFGIESSELLIIAVVALIAIGPKDLPSALRTAGRWVRKARMLTREFQHSVDEMIRQAELEELRDQAKKLSETNLKTELEKTIDPSGDLQRQLTGTLDPLKPDTDPSKPAEPAQIAHVEPEPVSLVEVPQQGDLLGRPDTLVETPHPGDVLAPHDGDKPAPGTRVH